ncbi:uncharacterized protein LOC126812474 [Patella vulgata]|uniref:uncharacterized protein LOC126812474 n=1 Tax=Patella vulgata TaxID=6465 RepID=UPI0024A9AB5F|nr:uncharacterized protein LOC126812474 [Patella vulgata]
MKKYALLILVVLVNVDDTKSQTDFTRQENAKGEHVVQAVVDAIRSHCIFASDRLFLRRLALVQSNDGEDAKTYRDSYHGGIWQVDKEKYEQTRTCPGILEYVCENIKTRLRINWQRTTWRDLRKPLYSGMAASLFIMYTLTFVVDGSGSIGRDGFNTVRQFMIEVTNRLDIGPKMTQVAAVTFSHRALVEFYLNDHSTERSLNQAISEIEHPSITVFAIGVGNKINENELKVISSDPYCTHVFILRDFSEIETIINAIQKRACRGVDVSDPIKAFHQNPLDSTKFIKCDVEGNMYVIQCPSGEQYHQDRNKNPNTNAK